MLTNNDDNYVLVVLSFLSLLKTYPGPVQNQYVAKLYHTGFAFFG
jgi:hypothetical protein